MAKQREEMKPLPNKKRFHVLILHSSNDYDLAKQMFEEFEKKQFKCRIRHSSDAIKETKQELRRFWKSLCAIKTSCVVILLFSKHFMKSKRCKLERRLSLCIRAKYKKRYINLIPLSIDNTPLPNTYESLVRGMYIAGEEWCNWWPKVLKAVTEDVNRQCKYHPDDVNLNPDDDNSDSSDIESSDATDDEPWSSCGSDEEGNTVLDIVLFHLLEEVISEQEVDCESDDEFKDIMKVADLLMKLLDTASFPNRLKFLNVTSKSGGLSTYVGQMGLCHFHGILLNGCGMKINHKTLTLKWEIFEQNLARSNITLADIVCYGKMYGIHNFRLEFNQEGLDKFAHQYGQNLQTLFQEFGENVLKKSFRDRGNDRMTYRVKITGHANELAQQNVNKSAKSLCQTVFSVHSEKETTYETRLATYHNWPKCSKVLTEALAATGFIYTGTGDTVACCSCNQSIYGFFGHLDRLINIGCEKLKLHLMDEHKYWNPNCTFEQKPLVTISEMPNTVPESSMENSIVIDDEFEYRLGTFSSCLPEPIRITLAEAGFVSISGSMGEEEKFISVRCNSCDVFINIDVDEDIWVQHIRWSPDCEHVHENKSENYIKAVRNMLARNKQDETKLELLIETLPLKKDMRQDAELGHLTRTRTQTQYIEQDIELD